MTSTDREAQMAARVRRHMLTSLAGVVVGVGCFGAAGAVASQLPQLGKAAPVALGVVGFLAMPAFGFGSTFRNLRCPACERLVIAQVSWNYSLFSAMASKTCPNCGERIFGEQVGRRFRRMMLVLVGVVFAAMILAGVGGYLSQKHKAAHAATPPTSTAAAP